MSLTVRYFASVREAVGIASEPWPTDMPIPTTVAQARAALVARGAPWAEALAESLCCVLRSISKWSDAAPIGATR